MNDEKVFLQAPEAISRLPDCDSIHTFRQAGPTLVGCDWDRADIIELLEGATEIEVTGEHAQAINHGLAVKDSLGWLFIETRQAPAEP